MDPQAQQTSPEKHPVHQITLLSKYLAMILLIVLPFLGGYVGYVLAPEKVVEIESLVKEETDLLASSTQEFAAQGDTPSGGESVSYLGGSCSVEHCFVQGSSDPIQNLPKGFGVLEGYLIEVNDSGMGTDVPGGVPCRALAITSPKNAFTDQLRLVNENHYQGFFNGSSLESQVGTSNVLLFG